MNETSVTGQALGQRSRPGAPDPAARVDVHALAAGPVPEPGWWLLVTAVDLSEGEEPLFEAELLPADARTAAGGDVVAHVRPTDRTAGPQESQVAEPDPRVDVDVWAVIRGAVAPVGRWRAVDGTWPDTVALTAAFAMGRLTELETAGVDLDPRGYVRLGHDTGGGPAGSAGVPARS